MNGLIPKLLRLCWGKQMASVSKFYLAPELFQGGAGWRGLEAEQHVGANRDHTTKLLGAYWCAARCQQWDGGPWAFKIWDEEVWRCDQWGSPLLLLVAEHPEYQRFLFPFQIWVEFSVQGSNAAVPFHHSLGKPTLIPRGSDLFSACWFD